MFELIAATTIITFLAVFTTVLWGATIHSMVTKKENWVTTQVVMFLEASVWTYQMITANVINVLQEEFTVDVEGMEYLRHWSGEKLVLFHGSPFGAFDEFSLEHYDSNSVKKYYRREIRGLYFSTSPTMAREYALRGEGKEGYNPVILMVHLKCKNPFETYFPNKHGIRAKGFDRTFKIVRQNNHDMIIWHKTKKVWEEVFKGHKEAAEYIVFDPRQVEIVKVLDTTNYIEPQ